MAERTITVNGAERPYLEQIFWAGLATLSYLPSTVFPTGPTADGLPIGPTADGLPIGPTADGLPIGLQAIGAEFHDRTTIEFARLVAEELGGFQAPPGYGA
jgi:amidase